MLLVLDSSFLQQVLPYTTNTSCLNYQLLIIHMKLKTETEATLTVESKIGKTLSIGSSLSNDRNSSAIETDFNEYHGL